VVEGLDAIEARTPDAEYPMSEAVDATAPDAAAPSKSGVKGIILGILAAVGLGGAAFYAVYSGLVDELMAPDPGTEKAATILGEVAFVPMDPIMISLPPGASAKLLRFSGQLEVVPAHVTEVTVLMPRILDVLNTYLRAVDVRDLEDPASAMRLRAQMLRRVQIVTGEGRVRDLLVTEFVMN
jgi:flagellar FliL protein